MKIQRWCVGNRSPFVAIDANERPLELFDDFDALVSRKGRKDPALLRAATETKTGVLAPTEPSKIVCIGRNYGLHAKELGNPLPEQPLIFLKPNTAIIADGQTIELPARSNEVHFEGELAVVIAKKSKNLSLNEAAAAILGFTLMNDVTARDIQRSEGKFTHGKGYDTFAPLGPTIATDLDPEELAIKTTVNNEVRQSSGCHDMIFKIPELIVFITSIMTLLPGDVISTGTPAGVGPIVDGDIVQVTIAEIGTLANPVRNA